MTQKALFWVKQMHFFIHTLNVLNGEAFVFKPYVLFLKGLQCAKFIALLSIANPNILRMNIASQKQDWIYFRLKMSLKVHWYCEEQCVVVSSCYLWLEFDNITTFYCELTIVFSNTSRHYWFSIMLLWCRYCFYLFSVLINILHYSL